MQLPQFNDMHNRARLQARNVALLSAFKGYGVPSLANYG